MEVCSPGAAASEAAPCTATREPMPDDLTQWRGTWAFVTSPARYTVSVRDRLIAAGIPAYVPERPVIRRYPSRPRPVTERQVIWPCYTFVCLPEGCGHGEVRHLPGMFDRAGRAMIFDTHGISDQDRIVGDLSNLKLALDNEPTEMYVLLGIVPGTKVVVTDGPFQNLVGVVDKTGSPGRLILNVDMLGRRVEMEIDGGLLEPFDN